ncbi:hypothetical protein V1291_005300 [Nitrobacteraceae bacterium AZCC 1564]
MAKIESHPLPPINFGTTIREADRSAVYGIIGRELNSILNGADSHHPDGGRKDVQTSYSELEAFIADLQKLQGDVNDPSNILSSVLSDLGHIQKALEKTMEDEEALDDGIQMKPEFAPNSSDSNIIDPRPFQDWVKAPLAPRNIRFQQQARAALSQGQNLNSQPLMFQAPNGRPVTDTGWQNEANLSPFASAHEAAPFASYPSMRYSAARLSGQTFDDQARVLRLVPSQEQVVPDSSAFMRSPADQGVAASVAQAPSDNMNELLKLRSMIQAVGSRGLFPIQ